MAHEAQKRYSDLVLAKLRAELVLADGFVFNNDYEGDPKAGAVKIPVRDTEVAVSDYDKANGLAPTTGSTTYTTLVIDKDNVQTHCEIAFKDHYGPGSGDPYSKWDLWFLPDYRHRGLLVPGGALLRGKALFYRNEMRKSA